MSSSNQKEPTFPASVGDEVAWNKFVLQHMIAMFYVSLASLPDDNEEQEQGKNESWVRPKLLRAKQVTARLQKGFDQYVAEGCPAGGILKLLESWSDYCEEVNQHLIRSEEHSRRLGEAVNSALLPIDVR